MSSFASNAAARRNVVDTQNTEVRTRSVRHFRPLPRWVNVRLTCSASPSKPQAFAALLIFFDKVSSEAPLQYIVTLIDDILEEDSSRVTLLIQAGDK